MSIRLLLLLLPFFTRTSAEAINMVYLEGDRYIPILVHQNKDLCLIHLVRSDSNQAVRTWRSQKEWYSATPR